MNCSMRWRGLILLLCVVLACVTPDSEAKKKGSAGINATIPLYEDTLGWNIWSAKSGVELVDWYSTGKFRAFDAGVFLEFSAFEHMMDEPEKFVGFALQIPDDLITYWSKNSVVNMTCVYKGDTCTVASVEFLIQRLSQPGVLVRSGDMKGFVPVGGEKCDVFKTPVGNPVLFFKFPISQTPDLVIGCTVENVMTKGGKR
ncbi:MAG TPA: hypothetical protein VMX58_01140 [Patescibacteria group bacterium]|nr:hypothetical protein [Patescibacteria group bacterium]